MNRFLPIFSFLVVAVATSHAALPAQIYWHTALPNTPMPSIIRDLLLPGHKEKPVVVDVKELDFRPWSGKTQIPGMRNSATETQIHNNRITTLFFLEKELHPGAKLLLHFAGTTSDASFLPRPEANSIPFSSTKLPEILTHFSIEPNSVEAEVMKETLEDCEAPSVDGETKYCATSLESMVDFSTSILRTRDVRAMSTEVGKEGRPKQEYTIAPSGVRQMAVGSKLVGCHVVKYAYAVFYCHAVSNTKEYTVQLVAKDGSMVEAVAVYHFDTAVWNPAFPIFHLLKVKPGTALCHFLTQDDVMWSPNN